MASWKRSKLKAVGQEIYFCRVRQRPTDYAVDIYDSFGFFSERLVVPSKKEAVAASKEYLSTRYAKAFPQVADTYWFMRPHDEKPELYVIDEYESEVWACSHFVMGLPVEAAGRWLRTRRRLHVATQEFQKVVAELDPKRFGGCVLCGSDE